ncbi:MAG: ATP-binding protein [Alphaproteobacteria bacterium]|nr:ATP-binding protein [Alphaproteobacteria bacterium]
MSLTNRERVRRGLDELKAGIIPFVERELQSKVGPYWKEELVTRQKFLKMKDNAIDWDTHGVLKAMVDNWQGVFRYVLGPVERSYVSELLDVRNKWAHETPFTSDDVYRALDTMHRMLQAISEGERAEALGEMKAELQRTVYAEQARSKLRAQTQIEGMPQAGLSPWRELIVPHTDVASGRYMQAEFAADLAQVLRGEGSPEYRDPEEFFRRTYITAGLRELLVGALQRVSGVGGDPVVELQTNFGGGKTHSMLALYHLFGETPASRLEGTEPVLKAAEVSTAATARRAVLVGTALSPAKVVVKPDGTQVRTLWGEMAWQIGGAEAFAMIAESDRASTAPGSDDLSALFRRYAPVVVLIDEWVAHARQLVGRNDLPAGSFEAQGSFAQALTEAAKRAPQTLVVASIPASKIEIGGENGQYALEVLKNVFERVGKPWRPATSDEGFEIVRRRLFEPIEPGKHVLRDAVLSAFGKMYRENAGDFPSECGEGSYRDDMVSCYPVHPELFRRLYDDWSTLDKFQRTRGVLRLLAKVIHRLWVSGDNGLLIMPASIPMDDGAVKDELTRYLPEVWEPIISQDVDGPNSTPLKLDQDVRHLGRYSACRRVARALYVGTAPGAEGPTPGVGAERIRLACAQPGETVSTFGDALRRISDTGRYVYQDGNRYWLSTRPNLNRTADDRAKALLREPEELYGELIKRLEAQRRNRGDFSGVHVAPQSPSDVPDETDTRLVVLRPDMPHRRGKQDSPAYEAAQELLKQRATQQPRLHRNTLVFLAPDNREVEKLLEATAAFLAWTSILQDSKTLDLTESLKTQAETKLADADRSIDIRIGATWIWALVPHQEHPAAEIELDEVKVSGNDPLPKRTSSKLVIDEALMPRLGGVRLRMVLDKHLWSGRDHVAASELLDWFPKYVYLPRLKDRETMLDAIREGASTLTPGDTFSTAEAFDEDSGRYLGLRVGAAPASVGNSTLIVKTEVARAQQERDREAERQRVVVPVAPPAGKAAQMELGSSTSPTSDPGPVTRLAPAPAEPRDTRPNRFVGSVHLDGLRMGRDAAKIAEELLSHLVGLSGAQTSISLEIQVTVPDGIEDDVVRTVSENASVLGFALASFEKE